MGSLRGTGPRPGCRRLIDRVVVALEVEVRRMPPRALLERQPASVGTVSLCEPTGGAVVLGSSQPESVADADRCREAGLDVLRRRSGGGAVLVRPGGQLWVDVFVPRGDDRFDDDVLASFAFLGSAWCEALADSLPGAGASLSVASGRSAPATTWSKVLCFAGLGAGEVSVEGRKVVGISQRRDRLGAWFHSMALLDLDPIELPSLLDLDPGDRAEAAGALASGATAVPGGSSAAPALLAALIDHLS